MYWPGLHPSSVPVILGGDFNNGPDSEVYK